MRKGALEIMLVINIGGFFLILFFIIQCNNEHAFRCHPGGLDIPFTLNHRSKFPHHINYKQVVLLVVLRVRLSSNYKAQPESTLGPRENCS